MSIHLKPITPELLDLVPQWYQKPELSEYFRNWPPLQDINRADLILQKLDWAYSIYEGNKVVGVVSLYYSNPIAKTIEVGMLVDTGLTVDRNKVSFEAHQQILNYIFKELGYQKVYMRILSHREKLCKRLCEFGYIIEGCLVRSAKFNGQLCNELLLAYHKD